MITPTQQWNKKMLKLKSRLQKSGLWADLLNDLDIALEIGFETQLKFLSFIHFLFAVGVLAFAIIVL